ncbi:acyl carrier protein [compost metagenome]
MRLNEDLRIDSIMIVQLIVYIELEMKLSVPDEMIDPRAFSTIGSLLEFMQGLEPLSELGLESKSESKSKSKDDDLEVEVKAGETR